MSTHHVSRSPLSRRSLLTGSLAVAGLAAVGVGSQTLAARADTGAPPITDFWSGRYPITDGWQSHLARGSSGGIDFGMPAGTQLLACMDGVVTRIWDYGTGGYTLRITHDNGWASYYCHCSSFVAADGQRVRTGELVALSGGEPGTPGAGSADGPHLHWHLHTPGDQRVNPLDHATAGTGGSTPVARDFRVHHVSMAPWGWNVHDTQVTVPGHTQFSVANLKDTAVALYIANDTLHMLQGGSFKVLNSGLRIGNGSTLGAVQHSSNAQPQALVVEQGRLHHVFAGSSRWEKLASPVTMPGNTVLESVDMGPGWPQAMANEDGRLHQVWANKEGWKNWDTGVRLQAGSRLSVMPNEGWPQLMTLQGNRMHHVFGTKDGWRNLPSNLVLDGPCDLSMIATKKGPTGIGVSNGNLLHVGPGNGGWVGMPMGKRLSPGTRVYTVASNSGWPQAFALSPA